MVVDCRAKKVKREEFKKKKKMFTCIACSKPEDGGDDEGGVRGSGTPSTKEAVKSLTAQVPNPTPSLLLYIACAKS